jgi:hypothetical protein
MVDGWWLRVEGWGLMVEGRGLRVEDRGTWGAFLFRIFPKKTIGSKKDLYWISRYGEEKEIKNMRWSVSRDGHERGAPGLMRESGTHAVKSTITWIRTWPFAQIHVAALVVEPGYGVWGLGFGVSRFRVWGLGFDGSQISSVEPGFRV